MLTFWILIPQPSLPILLLCIVELVLLLILAYEIIVYADLGKGR